MAVTNNTILSNVWLSATNDYQQRVPDPTQNNIADTVEYLFDPMNRNYYNQFLDILINRIGFTYVRAKRWDNPLAIFKDGTMSYGSTIQEIGAKWIKAHAYADDAVDVWRLERPEAEVWYHSQNRQDYYEISIVRDELRAAFLEEGGLESFIANIMGVPINSDNYDEYLIQKQLIAEYNTRWGFYTDQVSAITSEATAKALFQKLRAYAGKLRFPSKLYNHVDIPVFVNPEELVLFVTPEVDAALDVQGLAGLFHVEYADVKYRKIILDEFPIEGAVALLTTRDFFVCKDTLYENTSVFNPKTLSTNYWLHHWGVYSVSPFVPAILFSTSANATTPSTWTMTPTGITLSLGSQTVSPGGEVSASIQLNGTKSDGLVMAPNGAEFELSCTRTTEVEGEDVTVSIPLNSRTYMKWVNGDLVLRVQKTGIQAGDVITINATSTYINPSGTTSTYTDDTTITVA